MSDSDSMGGSGSDLSGELPPTSARRASGRRRRFQVIGVLAVVAVAAAVIVGISTSGSRSGSLTAAQAAAQYAGATLTCKNGGQTILTMPSIPTEQTRFEVTWEDQLSETTTGTFVAMSTARWEVATPVIGSARPTIVTVQQSSWWSINASCT